MLSTILLKKHTKHFVLGRRPASLRIDEDYVNHYTNRSDTYKLKQITFSSILKVYIHKNLQVVSYFTTIHIQTINLHLLAMPHVICLFFWFTCGKRHSSDSFFYSSNPSTPLIRWRYKPMALSIVQGRLVSLTWFHILNFMDQCPVHSFTHTRYVDGTSVQDFPELRVYESRSK
jgi:hypothetical protein